MSLLDLVSDVFNSKAAEVRSRLARDFDRDLFDAILKNLIDSSNKLRLNNFSYAAREFIRCYLSSFVDDNDVKRCEWFKSPGGRITRVDRMMYAIHRGLSPDYIENELGIDTSEVVKSLRNSIDILSKFTHISETTFPSNSLSNEIALNLFDALANFINTIHITHQEISSDLEHEISKEIEDGFFMEYFESIDHLATHHGLEDVYIDSIKIDTFDSQTLKFKVDGQLEFSLQWGSNSDVRNDIGAVGEITVPFSAIVESDIADIKSLSLASYQLNEDSLPY